MIYNKTEVKIMNYQSVINSIIKPYEQRIIEISDEIWKLAETKLAVF